MKQRNYSLDLLKLYFAFCVALGHSHLPTRLPVLNMDYVVTLFFILSGYFMVRSVDAGRYTSAWQFTWNRVCRIWPHYVSGFIVLFLISNFFAGTSVGELVKKFCYSLPEILMVQNTGIFPEGINYPAWQLSTLIFASHLLFTLLRWNRDMALNLICPLVAACGFACLGQDVDYWGVAGYFFYIPLLRAVTYLSLGMFLYDPIVLLLQKMEESTLRQLPVLVSGATLVFLVILWINRNHATLMILPFIGLLICLMYPGNFWAGLFQHPGLRCLENLSLGIYFNHAAVICLMDHLPRQMALLDGLPVDLLYLGFLLIYSMISMHLVNGLCGLLKKSIFPKQNI